ncbi:hypothetical protein B0H11DRAFT_1916324 [Mycena galericulata]|nr:hypothetical protein B0H11DRAFT_1916324 [Mycena galericulata]
MRTFPTEEKPRVLGPSRLNQAKIFKIRVRRREGFRVRVDLGLLAPGFNRHWLYVYIAMDDHNELIQSIAEFFQLINSLWRDSKPHTTQELKTGRFWLEVLAKYRNVFHCLRNTQADTGLTSSQGFDSEVDQGLNDKHTRAGHNTRLAVLSTTCFKMIAYAVNVAKIKNMFDLTLPDLNLLAKAHDIDVDPNFAQACVHMNTLALAIVLKEEASNPDTTKLIEKSPFYKKKKNEEIMAGFRNLLPTRPHMSDHEIFCHVWQTRTVAITEIARMIILYNEKCGEYLEKGKSLQQLEATYNELLETKRKQSEEIRSLKEDCNKAEKSALRQEEFITHLENEVKDQQQQVEGLEASRRVNFSSSPAVMDPSPRDEAEKANRRCKQKLESKEKSISTLETKMEDAQKKLETEVTQLAESGGILQVKKEELERKNKKLDEQLRQLTLAQEKVEDAKDKAERQHKDAEKRAETAIAELTSCVKTLKARAAAEVESWREEKVVPGTRLFNTAHLAEVESKLQSLRSMHASLQTEKEDFQLKVSSVQTEKESELQKLRSTHATFQAKTDSELTSHKTTIGRLQTKLKELEEEKQRAVQDKDTSTAEADRQLKDAKERAETTIVQLKSRVEDLETEAAAAVESWRAEKAEVESKLQSLRSTHASLQTEKEELQSKDTLLQAAETSLQAAKTSNESTIMELQRKLTELKVEVQNADQDKTTSIAEVSEVKSLQAQAVISPHEHAILSAYLSFSQTEAYADNIEAGRQLQWLRQRDNSLTRRLAEVLQDNAVREGDITRLEDDLKEQIAQLVEKIHENDALLEELEQLRVDNEKLRAQTMKLQKDHRASVDALRKLKLAYFEAKKTIEAVQNDAQMKEAEAERNSEEREARARTEIRNLTEMLQKLEHELEAARVGVNFSYWADAEDRGADELFVLGAVHALGMQEEVEGGNLYTRISNSPLADRRQIKGFFLRGGDVTERPDSEEGVENPDDLPARDAIGAPMVQRW